MPNLNLQAVNAFLFAVMNEDMQRAMEIVRTEPELVTTSLHVAAVLGRADAVRRLVSEDPAQITMRAGPVGGEPLLWLCHSPLHGESPERDEELEAAARALLAAGADPNSRDEHMGLPALYAVTGVHNAPRIARMLLEAGAEPNDGESLFHAAERFHEEALDLLLGHGADVNGGSGNWGNTPLYFLLRYHDATQDTRVKQGILWLLDYGADPDVRSGDERETALHIAVRRGQDREIVKLLIEHGADVNARRTDGKSAWILAARNADDALTALLEESGAVPETLSPADALVAACSRGDIEAARALAVPEVTATLGLLDHRLLPEATADGHSSIAKACIAAGFPVDTADEFGATALHHAAIRGRAELVHALLQRGADFTIRDHQHRSTPLGWATFGADHVAATDGDYEETVRALLRAGARPQPDEHVPADPGLQQVLKLPA